MANGRLRCIGSAQHLKSKFGKNFQIELKISAIDPSDSDYQEILHALCPAASHQGDEESSTPDTSHHFDFDETITALNNLTGDSSLSSMVQAENTYGYAIWKEATSVRGCPIDELAEFSTLEMRLRNVDESMKTAYPGATLRERQDSKVRYEIPAAGNRIANIFSSMEEMKCRLRIAEYGVSQTTLEQVFNMHAAEAELVKQSSL
jgi:hypothetical protein